MPDLMEDGPSFQIPPGRMFGDCKPGSRTDVKIRLTFTLPTAGTSSDGTAGTVCRSMYAHKIALEAGSTYFKGLFTTGQEIAGPPAAKKARTEGQQDTADQPLQVIDLPCESEADADAMQAVLSYLHDEELPNSPTFDMLYKMFLTADYLGADQCIQACAVGFSELQLSEEHALQISNIFDTIERCPACSSETIEDLQKARAKGLLANYGNVYTIIDNRDKLARFCNLPLDVIEAWGGSDDLIFDSENSIAVLLNHWWHSQAAGSKTQDCKKRLSNLIRLPVLSKSYLVYMLSKLDWFISPIPEYIFACSVIRSRANSIPNAWLEHKNSITTQHRKYIGDLAKLEMHVSLQQIQEAVNTHEPIIGPTRYWQGHCFTVSIEAPREACTADNVAIFAFLRQEAADLMPEGTPATLDIHLRLPYERQDHLIFIEESPESAILVLEGKTAEAAVSEYLSDDQHLTISALIGNVDGIIWG